MVIANAGKGDRKIIILGLTRQNFKRMVGGEPVIVSELTNAPRGALPEGFDIVICYGETEEAIYKAFKSNGFIGEKTKIGKLASDDHGKGGIASN